MKHYKDSGFQAELPLDLRKPTERYSGLEILEGDSTDIQLNEIIIEEWAYPLGPERPLKRRDFPEMGSVVYEASSERPWTNQNTT
jgi:hypothetical protein